MGVHGHVKLVNGYCHRTFINLPCFACQLTVFLASELHRIFWAKGVFGLNADLVNIRKKIRLLYETNPEVSIYMSVNRSKTNMQKINALIIGVYPNLFTAESEQSGLKKHYNFQYADVLTGGIKVEELDL